MGTINYGTSDYITMGIRPYDIDDWLNDSHFLEIAKENGIDTNDESSLMLYVYDDINDCYKCDRENAEYYLKNEYSFNYFHITLKTGYYEGSWIDIENNFSIAFDSWEDKREAQKEITQIKRFLIDCAGCGFVACSPGWCTRYSDYKETLKEISAAIKAMREEVKRTPTWIVYNRESA